MEHQLLEGRSFLLETLGMIIIFSADMVKNSNKSDYFSNHYFKNYDLKDYLIDLLDQGLTPKEIEETIKVGGIQLDDEWRKELRRGYDKHYKKELDSK